MCKLTSSGKVLTNFWVIDFIPDLGFLIPRGLLMGAKNLILPKQDTVYFVISSMSFLSFLMVSPLMGELIPNIIRVNFSVFSLKHF